MPIYATGISRGCAGPSCIERIQPRVTHLNAMELNMPALSPRFEPRADKSRHPQAMQVAVSTRKPRYCDSKRRQLRHFGCQLISPQICISLPPRWQMSAVSRKLRPWPARRAQIGAHIRMLLRHALRLGATPPETNEYSGISPQPAHKGSKSEHHPRPRKSSSTALRQARPTTPHCLTLDTALATASKLAAVP